MTTTSADHLLERRASWRWRLAVAVAAAVAVVGSTLTATLPAHADPTWPVLLPDPVAAPVEGVTDRTIHRAGTDPLEFELNVPEAWAPKPCENDYDSSTWVRLVDPETGEGVWGSSSTRPSTVNGAEVTHVTFTRDFLDDEKLTAFQYPGGDYLLDFYQKEDAQGWTCLLSVPPDDLLEYAAPYRSETLRVEWETPRVESVEPSPESPEYSFRITPSREWGESVEAGNGGFEAIEFFEITGFGTADEEVTSLWDGCSPSYDGTGTCEVTPSLSGGSVLGAAVKSPFAELDVSDGWPVKGAISYATYAPDKSPAADAAAMTQGGPSESTACVRMCAADPIDTFTGNLFERATDLDISGRVGISLDRAYSTGTKDVTGAFGAGWLLGWDMSVDESTAGRPRVVEPSGNLTAFRTVQGKLSPVAPSVRATLTRVSGGFEYTRWDDPDRTFVFGSGGALTGIRGRGDNQVTLTRDTDGQVTRASEGGRWVDLTWEDGHITAATDHTGRTVTYTYGADDRLATVTTPGDRTTAYGYTAAGRLDHMVAPDGGVTDTTYNAGGRAIRQVLPSGDTVRLTYGAADSNGVRVTRETTDEGTRTYTYKRGRIAKYEDSTDPLAGFTRTYSSSAQIAQETKVTGGALTSILNTYTAAGDLAAVHNQSTGAVTEYEYDAHHRVVSVTGPDGVTVETERDGDGNPITETVTPTDGAELVTSRVFAGNGDLTEETDPAGGVTTFDYTADGDLEETTGPAGDVTTIDTDALGRTVTETAPHAATEDQILFQTAYTYDPAGNTATVTTRDGVTTYTYDAAGRAVSVTDPRGSVQEAEYDTAGNRTEVTYPDASTDTFTYDHAGRRTSWTDRSGELTTYTYDGASTTTTQPSGAQVTEKTSIEAGSIVTRRDGVILTAVTPAQTLTYPDGVTGTVQVADRDSSGRTTRETTSDGESITYEYDGLGRLATKTQGENEVTYAYDAAGRETRVTYPNGSVATRTYDLAGRVTSVSGFGGEYTYGYLPGGRISSMTPAAGAGYTQAWDGARATTKTWTSGEAYGRTYDQAGLVATEDDTTHTFDAEGRLTTDATTWDDGLLTGLGGTTLTYEDGHLATAGTDTVAFDDRGNRTADGTATYAWDALDRLTGTDGETYGYDTAGIRTRSGDDAQVYDQQLKLLQDGGTAYLWAPDGTLLAQQDDEGAVLTATTDLAGSVTAMRDASGAFTAQYGYTAFGDRALTAGVDVTVIGYRSEQHGAAGLIYLRARYYDPTTGQFLSVDPLVAVTLDRYGYADGNPLQIVDPLGLFGWEDVDAWAGGLGTAVGVLGLVAVGAGLVATAPALVSLATATVTVSMVAGFAGAAYGAARTCWFGAEGSCGWSIAGVAVSLVPGFSRTSSLAKIARTPRPVGASVQATNRWSETTALAGTGYVLGNSHGVAFDALKRMCEK